MNYKPKSVDYSHFTLRIRVKHTYTPLKKSASEHNRRVFHTHMKAHNKRLLGPSMKNVPSKNIRSFTQIDACSS